VPKMGDENIGFGDAWMLGLAIADGHVSQTRNEVHFTIGKHEKFRTYLEEKFSMFGRIRSKTHTSSNVTQRITIANEECHSFFAKYIIGKLIEKKFTTMLFDLSKESRLHVLGGYFDGDGSFNKQNGKLIANNYSCDMADQLYWLLLSVGIKVSLGRHPLYGDHYETDSKWCYRLQIPQSDILKLKPYMRSDKIPNDFKPRSIRELRFFYEDNGITYLAQPIESIKQFKYTGAGYDIQIDPERSFVASGFVTSNCRFWYENEPKVAAAIDFYCFAPETQILMASGVQKSISSIRPGDLVRSHDGTINQVSKTFARKTNEDILNIQIAGVCLEKALRVTKGHKLLTKIDGKIKFVQAQQLQEGGHLLTPSEYSDSSQKETTGSDFDKEGKYIFRKILSIKTSNYVGIVYDLEVENSHSYVANKISCSNSRFPMNGFKLECPDRKILSFFEHHVVKKLKLNERLKEISSEYYMLGDVFIHTDIKCSICGGTAIDPDTQEECNHPGGTFTRVFVMNPDWIEVQRSPLTDDPLIVLIPDEELQQIVHKRQPKAIYDRIPEHLKPLIMAKAP
ncbi:hypothetical protein LCGC14_2322830, partial [marine sediment metagenome]